MFRIAVISFCFLVNSSFAFASINDSTPSAFLNLIEAEKKPENKIKLYHALAEYNITVSLNLALQYSNNEMLLAESLNNTQQIAEACIVRSEIFNQMYKPDSAWHYITMAEAAAKKNADKNLDAKIEFQKGEYYFFKGDLVNALSKINSGYMQFSARHDSSGMMEALYLMSEIYYQQNNFKASFHKASETLAIANDLGDRNMKSNALINIGNYYYMTTAFDSALHYYNLSIQYISPGNQSKVGQAFSNIGDVYVEKKMFTKALEYFQKAKPMIMQTGDREKMAHLYTVFGRCYFFQKNYSKAVPQFDSSIVICKLISNFDLLSENYGFLSDLYAEQHDYKMALQYELLVEQSKDSLTKIFTNKDLLKLQTQFEAFKKEKDNELLTAKNKVAEVKLVRQRISIVALSISLALLALIGLLTYRLYRQRSRNFHKLEILHSQLAIQKENIEQLNNMLEIRAVRAQMDPHFLFNCMVSIQHLIMSDQKESAIQYLTKFSKLLRMVLENADNNTVELKKEVEMLSLYLDLESIRFKQEFRYQINVDPLIDAEAVELPTLLIQPFAENALWHGLADKITNRVIKISFSKKDDMIECVVEDNGVGRKQAAINNRGRTNHKSKAMQMIADRIAMIRTQSGNEKTGLEFVDLFDQNNAAAGTRVVVTLPLK